jgi:hypothetical protein
MAAGVYDFTIEQGTTFYLPLQWKPGGQVIDITEYSIRMQVRSSELSDTLLLDLSNRLGNIEVTNALIGSFRIVITPQDTSGVNWTEAKYDIEITNTSNEVYRILKGNIILDLEVTRFYSA